MADIRIDGTDVVVRLTRREKLAALSGDVRVPRRAVHAAEVVDGDAALAAVRGFRAPGLHVPWRTKTGTWRRAGGRTLAVVRRDRPAVRLLLTEGQRHREIVVSTPDAAATVAALR